MRKLVFALFAAVVLAVALPATAQQAQVFFTDLDSCATAAQFGVYTPEVTTNLKKFSSFKKAKLKDVGFPDGACFEEQVPKAKKIVRFTPEMEVFVDGKGQILADARCGNRLFSGKPIQPRPAPKPVPAPAPTLVDQRCSLTIFSEPFQRGQSVMVGVTWVGPKPAEFYWLVDNERADKATDEGIELTANGPSSVSLMYTDVNGHPKSCSTNFTIGVPVLTPLVYTSPFPPTNRKAGGFGLWAKRNLGPQACYPWKATDGHRRQWERPAICGAILCGITYGVGVIPCGSAGGVMKPGIPIGRGGLFLPKRQSDSAQEQNQFFTPEDMGWQLKKLDTSQKE